MASEESDDEPLSVLAAAKKTNPDKFLDQSPKSVEYEPKKKKRKKEPIKKLGVTIKINRKLNTATVSQSPTVIERPTDVWLYLKDLKPTGPYSCLLCHDWFINRSKMIMHYALNHKKDFCGICRYFVPDREVWFAHEKFHTPWPCSQCVETFPTEPLLRKHLKSVHNLVHCRLCHFRVTADDHYNTHLFQKHSVTNVSCKDEEKLWEFDYDGADKFLCLLCSKPDNLLSTFFGHYMGFHHFTLKCLTGIVAGKDAPFTVNGAEVSTKFLEEQLKGHERLGYVDLEQKSFEADSESNEKQRQDDNLMNSVFIPEIKQENFSDSEEQREKEHDMSEKDDNSQNDENANYKGDEDFDVTLTELIVLEKSYYDYISKTLVDINANTVPICSSIDYDKIKADIIMDVECSLCKSKFENALSFTTHMNKMHSIKTVPIYSCRVCATTFDNYNELASHITEELADFDDLWICQFCDKEFDNREATRKHLTEHWNALEFDNCFSPHLGFKCKFCPTLFWNETDREKHQITGHFDKYKEHFYKCESCSKTFGDKVWFIHHHLETHFGKEEQMTSYLLKCCLCCTVLSSLEDMRSHFESEHPEVRKLYCSLDSCMYKPLSHRKSFKLHVKIVHGPSSRTEKPVNCYQCGREFASQRACASHAAQVHGPGKFKCKLCREMLQTTDERKLHYLLRHPGRHPFECSECGKSFQYKSSLYMHKQDHQPNKQNFSCSYCGKTFAKKDSYREHIQIHEGPRHACSYCPMRFVQRSNMLRHERRHTGERPYQCSHCPRTFADKGACTAHTRTHSRDSSYACVYCGQTFVQKSKLTYHIRKHTGENLESCTVCSKLFTSACSLREHMKTHVTINQVVKCPLCDKGYRDERYMLRHLRTSHTRSQFSCPLCHKLVTSASGLRSHVITHSTVNTFRCKCCPKSYAVRRTIIRHLRKRHGLKGTELDIKDYFTRVDPRECKLDLDEATMTSIFGPPKPKPPDVMLTDYVTYAKQFEASNAENKDDVTDDDSDDEVLKPQDTNSDKESSSEKHYEVTVKQEVDSADELEPTDFVSVKIEPIDEDENV